MTDDTTQAAREAKARAACRAASFDPDQIIDFCPIDDELGIGHPVPRWSEYLPKGSSDDH
jgi:hypothetical protein